MAGHTIASLQGAALASGLCTVAMVVYKLSPAVPAGWGWYMEGITLFWASCSQGFCGDGRRYVERCLLGLHSLCENI